MCGRLGRTQNKKSSLNFQQLPSAPFDRSSNLGRIHVAPEQKVVIEIPTWHWQEL